ncbi:selenium metabolism-associated LysR family transcriptional regulator [Marasmitruncus massiliensis]|uniref:selenium metabolism-associated LysR family transcriptional regulator n=1 Tax=Marasmitruncus massiliensis TaxID=1944642 RepID=UPI0011AFB7AD|nr:selenium metabolism-associated LysR family transcriptional regulator [Marasmitruncus massiliensis]
MDFKQLEAFAAVISLGSFSKAGERLFLTQPTISAHIRTLEKELGIKLIVRSTKEVYPSDAGKRLYVYAQNILRLRDDAIAAMSAKPTVQLKGTLSVAASTVPSQYILPEVMTAFRKEHADVAFRITHCDSASVARRIADGEAQIGMTGAVIDASHCSFWEFSEDELVVITPNTPKFRALGEGGFPLDSLTQEPFILRERGSGTRREFEQFLNDFGLHTDKLHVAAEMEDPEAIKHAVSEGMGISVISKRAAADFERFGMLLAFPPSGIAMTRKLYLVCRKNEHLSPQAKAFADFVLAYHQAKGETSWKH